MPSVVPSAVSTRPPPSSARLPCHRWKSTATLAPRLGLVCDRSNRRQASACSAAGTWPAWTCPEGHVCSLVFRTSPALLLAHPPKAWAWPWSSSIFVPLAPRLGLVCDRSKRRKAPACSAAGAWPAWTCRKGHVCSLVSCTSPALLLAHPPKAWAWPWSSSIFVPWSWWFAS